MTAPRLVSAVGAIIAVVKEIRSLVKFVPVEQRYLDGFPQVLEIAKFHYDASLTGASAERRVLSGRVDETFEPLQQALRDAGINEEREEILKDLVYFSELQYSRIYGVSNAHLHFLREAERRKLFEKLRTLAGTLYGPALSWLGEQQEALSQLEDLMRMNLKVNENPLS